MKPRFVLLIDIPGHIPSQTRLFEELSRAGEDAEYLVGFRKLCELIRDFKTPQAMKDELDRIQCQNSLSNWVLRNVMVPGFRATLSKILQNSLMRNSWVRFSFNRGLSQGSDSSKPRENLEVGPISSIYRKRVNQSITVIYPEFNYFYNHLSIYCKMKEQGALQVIVPYSLVNEEEWKLAFSKRREMTKKTIGNLLIDRFFPEWVRDVGGKRVRIPFKYALWAHISKYQAYNPWLPGAVLDISILTTDKYSRDYLIRSGYDSKHVSIGGMVDGVNLAKTRRDRLVETRNSGIKRVLVALPPDQAFRGTPEEYFKSMMDPILKPILSLQGITLQVSLHPRAEDFVKEELADRGIPVVHESVEEALSKSDIFVACASATLRVGEALGVTSINYDIYNFRYGDFDTARYISTVYTQSDYEKEILRSTLEKTPGEVDSTIENDLIERILHFSQARP